MSSRCAALVCRAFGKGCNKGYRSPGTHVYDGLAPCTSRICSLRAGLANGAANLIDHRESSSSLKDVSSPVLITASSVKKFEAAKICSILSAAGGDRVKWRTPYLRDQNPLGPYS